ncbi:MAG TPA: hypothetical protein VGL58_06325 [Caulobacteraceae bacterium]|jgi:hypothetical protein
MTALGISVSPRFKRLAPFFLAGPISGPLLAGIVLNFKEGRPVLGSLYAVLFTELTVYLPLITAKLSHTAALLYGRRLVGLP